MKHILSFGGGVNSSAMLVYMVKNRYPLDLVLFADTGDEHDYTYTSIDFYKKWTENNGIEFQIVRASYGKTLYQYCWDKKITPSRIKRDCTTKFKIVPMRKYLRTRYGKKEKFIRYIGIDYDEAHRISDSDRQYEINKYPLVDAKINREGCKKLLESYGLPIPEKSGCFFCPFTKKTGWINMLNKLPTLFDRAIALEQNGSRYPTPGHILSSQPLIKIKDRIVNQTSLIDFESTCDVSGSCFL